MPLVYAYQYEPGKFMKCNICKRVMSIIFSRVFCDGTIEYKLKSECGREGRIINLEEDKLVLYSCAVNQNFN